MFKKIISSLVALVMAFSIIPMSIMADDAGKTTVTIHYKRNNGDYDGWNIWCWPDGGEGAAYEFTKEDSFGKVAVIEFDSAVEKAGFIIRLNDWEAKDTFGDDRFIEGIKDGKAEIWVTEGVEEFATEGPKDDADDSSTEPAKTEETKDDSKNDKDTSNAGTGIGDIAVISAIALVAGAGILASRKKNKA